MKKSFVLLFLSSLLLLICLHQKVHATHNQAGQIEYFHAPEPGKLYRYCFTVLTYSRNESTSADRDTLFVNFGDGTTAGAPRKNGNGLGTPIPGTNVKVNRYEICHTYAGPFTYVVSMQDPNRIGDIINITNSIDEPFFIQDTLIIRDPAIFGFNNSPLLFQPPIDTANVGYTFVHNPNAYDPDGDSLYFELIEPLSNVNTVVNGYAFPDEINPAAPGGPNTISLNATTGEFIWETPRVPGIYNIAFLISEYRSGIFIGNMIRDMQVVVVDSDNTPPEIVEVNDTCIVIGENLIISVDASDSDVMPSQTIKFQAFGGPFEAEPPLATFEIWSEGFGFSRGVFQWNTECSHIFSSKYTVVFRAEDSFSPPLVDLETWQINLVPPPVPNISAEIAGGDIQINWEPHDCADSEKFRGYMVWRKAGCDSLEIDRCQLGLGGTGYQLLTPEPIQDLSFIDETANRGLTYSYRIVAEFADAFTNSNPPSPFNLVSSMASENTCIELPQNIPAMTHADVDVTDISNGVVEVAWSKPEAEALDTIANSGPYVYELYRSEGFIGANPILLGAWQSLTFSEANDTTFTDSGLNTVENAYSYSVKFFSGEDFLGETAIASTVFLGTSPSDNAVELSWEFNVPWINYQYDIFREQPDGSFLQVGTTDEEPFVDEGLVNGEEYCYYVLATGTYSSQSIVDPLLNRSQITCEVPQDMTAPCPPVLEVSNICEVEEAPISDELKNSLSWTNPNETCADTDDVIGYYIYYTSPFTQETVLLDSVNNPNILTYEHFVENSLAGCYQVAAIDSFYNESATIEVCVEACIEYELPNVFTPNDDNQNDLFVPRINQFVSSVNMTIFNRWGQLVYETTDPNINWDGTDFKSGDPLKEGVYYYVCEVLEQTSDGIEFVNLKLDGYIHLIRGK